MVGRQHLILEHTLNVILGDTELTVLTLYLEQFIKLEDIKWLLGAQRPHIRLHVIDILEGLLLDILGYNCRGINFLVDGVLHLF